MRTLALLFALSLFVLLNPTHSARNPIRLPTAGEAVKSDDTAVLDIDGDEVTAGQAYYISSYVWGAGGGEATLGKLNPSNKCPTDVLSTTTFEQGSPVRITPADATATVVLPSTFQTLEFSVPIIKLCVSSLFWRAQIDPFSRQFVVKLGELVPDLSDRFKIEPADLSISNVYKITYCPFGTDKCYNVGRSTDPLSRAMRLVLNIDDDEQPFFVVFKKAQS